MAAAVKKAAQDWTDDETGAADGTKPKKRTGAKPGAKNSQRSAAKVKPSTGKTVKKSAQAVDKSKKTDDAPPWDDDEAAVDKSGDETQTERADHDRSTDGNDKARARATKKRGRAASAGQKAAPADAGRDFGDFDDDDDAQPLGRSNRSGRELGARAKARSARIASAKEDVRRSMTLQLTGNDGDQFNVIIDGRAYWCGNVPPYKLEIKLAPGRHDMRVRVCHPMDKTPSEFVPLPLAIMLGDGFHSEIGPYFAALDVCINVTGDGKLTVKYTQTGHASARRAAFACTAGKGIECEVRDTSMGSTPRLMRRWKAANYITLAFMSALALGIVALGAYLAVRPGGSVSGGILVALLGAALAITCACMNGTIRTAIDGGYTPDMEFPRPKRKRAAGAKAAKKTAGSGDTDADAAPENADGDTGGDSGEATTAKRKPRAKATGRAKKPVHDIDYDGAYDDAGEMGDFEESGLSTADLTPQQLHAAKEQLLKKLRDDDGDEAAEPSPENGAGAEKTDESE